MLSLPLLSARFFPLKNIIGGGLLAIAFASVSYGQFWIRESTVLPEALTGSGSSGRGGTTTFTTSVYGGLEYNDNITLSSSAEGGLAARFGITSGLKYPVSENNILSFDMSLERLVYLTGPSGQSGYNNILPGTTTTFTVFIGSVRLRNFFSAELTEDPVASPVINNTSRFGRFNAKIGTQIDWDMNRVIWQANLSAGRQFATQTANEQIDLWQYAAALRAVVPMGPSTSVGLSTTYAINRGTFKDQFERWFDIRSSWKHWAGDFQLRILRGRSLSMSW